MKKKQKTVELSANAEPQIKLRRLHEYHIDRGFFLEIEMLQQTLRLEIKHIEFFDDKHAICVLKPFITLDIEKPMPIYIPCSFWFNESTSGGSHMSFDSAYSNNLPQAEKELIWQYTELVCTLYEQIWNALKENFLIKR